MERTITQLVAPPLATRCFFSFSSVWIMVLSMQAWPAYGLLSVFLFVTAISSFLHWSYFAYNSWLSLIDRFCACLVFMYVFCRGSGWTHSMLGFWSVLFFLLGNRAILWKDWEQHLHCHSLFRYCAFWMILQFCRAPVWAYEVILFSMLYSLHHMCMSMWLIDEMHQAKNGAYPKPANARG